MILSLFNESARFEEPLLIKHAFGSELCNQNDILELFQRMCDDRSRLPNSAVRVYVDGGASARFEDAVTRKGTNGHESLDHWCLSIFGEREFAIIVNKAERWSRRLCENIHAFLEPLLEKNEFEIEITLFIGNYQYTPFGYHVDDPDTTVIHFHLGPNTKVMHLIAPDVYRELVTQDQTRSFDFDRMDPAARTFPIGSGDIFVLPPKFYHYGSNAHFSAGIAVALIRKSAATVDANSIKHFLPDLVGSGMSLDDAVELARLRYMAASRSNGRMQLSPVESAVPVFSAHTYVKGSPAFPVCVVIGAPYIYVYARGRELKMLRKKQLLAFFDFVNTISATKIDAIYEKFKNEMEQDCLNELLTCLIRYGTLQAYDAA